MLTDELETRLREAFSRAAADIEVPGQARRRLLSRDYHPRTVNRKLTAVLAAAAAVAIAVPLAIGWGSRPAAAGPVLRLASYSFQLPAGYQLPAAAAAPCHVTVTALLPWDPNANDRRGPPGQTAMQAAASAAGGCIAAMLAPPYTPTAAVPDPEAPVDGAHPVQVGRYHGVIVHSPVLVFSVARFRAARHYLFTELFVPLPAGSGEMRDLVIGASRLSASELIKIAATGLAA